MQLSFATHTHTHLGRWARCVAGAEAGTAGAESGTHKFHLLVAIVVVTLAACCCCCCRYCLRSCLNNGHTTCPTAWLPLPQRLRLLHVAIGFSIIGQFNGCPNQTEMNPANQTAHTDKFPLLFAEVLMSVCQSVSLCMCVCECAFYYCSFLL